MTIAIILCALLAAGATVREKKRYRAWWQQWLTALLTAAGVALLGFILVGRTEMVIAAAFGAFLGLCWNPQESLER